VYISRKSVALEGKICSEAANFTVSIDLKEVVKLASCNQVINIMKRVHYDNKTVIGRDKFISVHVEYKIRNGLGEM